ncbi:hypothetical protein MP638_001174 [Amoeboaphelidium occidentale]|nr:hypothetical protein MP638_001174 [Amoeboaphelidium occidentale]
MLKSFMFEDTATAVVELALYNRSLLIATSTAVIQKDIETGSFLGKFIVHSGRVEVIMVTDNSRMITLGWDDMIVVWDLKTGSTLRRIWPEASNTFPQGAQLVSNSLFACGLDRRARIVNMISGRVVQTIDVNGAANVIVVNDDYFFVGKDGDVLQLEKYSITTRTLYSTFEGKDGDVLQLKEYSITTRTLYSTFEGHVDSIFSLLLHKSIIFSGSADTKIICRNTDSNQIIRVYNGHTGSVRALSIFENYLYSAGENKDILKWSIDANTIEKVFVTYHRNIIRCMVLEPGSIFSGSTDSTVSRWDLTML